jgi:hypothetical protein
MTDTMTTTIADYVEGSDTVSVTFTQGTVVFTRDVNIVKDSAGAYSPEDTADRVAQVAIGVAHKIAIGVIPTPTPKEATQEASVVESQAPGDESSIVDRLMRQAQA